MTKGREEKNWEKAKSSYKEVQNALVSAKTFELYNDGDRMLPNEIVPTCKKMEIKAEPLKAETMTMLGESLALKRKKSEENKKKKRDEKLNMPDDAFVGFRTAGQLAAASRAPPSPGQELRDRKTAACLTIEEETHLRSRWLFSGDERVNPVVFHPEDLPFELGNGGMALKIPAHSTRYGNLVSALATAAHLISEEALDSWNDKMCKAYNENLVEPWNRGQRKNPPEPHTRIRRVEPSPIPQSSLPIPSAYPAYRHSSVLLPGTASPRPVPPKEAPDTINPPPPPSPPPQLQPRQSPAISDSLQASLFDPPTTLRIPPPLDIQPLVLKKRLAIPNRTASLIIQETQVTPLQPLSITYPASHTLPPLGRLPSLREPSPTPGRDEYGILSSEPDEMPVRQAFPATFDTNAFDEDIAMSDSQLLRGAVVQGPPPKKSLPNSTRQDSPPTQFLPLPKTLQPHGKVTQRSGNTQKMLPQPASTLIPDSDIDEISDASDQAEPSIRKQAVQIVEDDIDDADEYDFYDLPEEELEALDAIRPEDFRGRQDSGQAIQSSGNAPIGQHLSASAAMLPPPPRTAVSSSPQVYRKRPQHHRIPDSDSSTAPQSVVRPARLNSPPGTSEILPELRRKEITKGKRKAVVDTSSPTQSHLPEVATPLIALNRMRRGRREPTSISEEEEMPKERPPKKVKRPRLTEKLAAKSNLFDFEAVNSDASGIEASSQSYEAENSDDRNFVADDDYDDSPGQQQFYRDSLATQAPPGFGPRAQRPGFRSARIPAGARYQVTPNTPGSAPDAYRYI